MSYIFYTITAIVVVFIIYKQVSIYSDTLKKIREYKKIFSGDYKKTDIADSQFSEDYDEEAEDNLKDEETEDGFSYVSQIAVDSTSITGEEIFGALNTYLRKNKGAAGDFMLMKDVVERYCDADKNEIEEQQPVPLYLGLCGTITGILIGVVHLGISGFSITNINSLMICVAIAMMASLLGIGLTVSTSLKVKDANFNVESGKNKFFTWLQTELLPSVSNNAVNAIYLLQQNLMQFNSSFKTNLGKLEKSLTNISDTTKAQSELIKIVQGIDVRRMADANIRVLKELQGCTDELSAFTKYINNVTAYLEHVRELNNKLDDSYERTKLIENIGKFFQNEIEQFEQRKQLINSTAAHVHDAVERALEGIKEKTEEQITKIDVQASKHLSTMQEEYQKGWDEFDEKMHREAENRMERYQNQWKIFDDLMQKQKEEFASTVKQLQDEFATIVKQQHEEIVAQNNNNSAFLEEMRQVAEVRPIMNEMLQTSREQIRILSDLSATMEKNRAASNSGMPAKQDKEKISKKPFFKRMTGFFKRGSKTKQQENNNA